MELISRQLAIDALDEIEAEVADGYGYQYAKWREYFVEMQSAQPERIKGRWISADAIFGGEPFYCSECGENTRDTVMGKPRWNFCPNCGADMREVTT